MNNLTERLTQFVKRIFKTTLEIFFEALKQSQNAQGYVGGAVSEYLLKQKLEKEHGMEVLRIREKWEGKKHPRHHGELYFRKRKGGPWYVMESKGVKSNSEEWHKLYNYDSLKKFLIDNDDKIFWINRNENVESQVVAWIDANLPKFRDEYAHKLYPYNEIQEYKQPKSETEKGKAVARLCGFSREQINRMIAERIQYVMSKLEVLETHLVSGKTGERTQATPRKDEFNILAVDLYLRYREHKFIFANPKNLDSSGADEEHLQQNYVIGFVFHTEANDAPFRTSEDWDENFDRVFETLDANDAVNEQDMQIDFRNLDANNEGEQS